MGGEDMRDSDVPGFGEALAAAREAAKLTQAQLAEKVGAHVVTICNIERGRRLPSLAAFFRLADALGLSLDVLRASAAKCARKKSRAG